MSRETYLNHKWHRYPAAPKGLIDAADYQGGRALVGGRIRSPGGVAPSLSANGKGFEFSFSREVRDWEAESFDTANLRDGDLVCLELNDYQVTRVLLLAPAVGEYTLSFTIETANRWADFKDEVRQFFRKRNFVEASTPTLVPSPGTEPHLDPFTTAWEYGTESHEFYLPTSPEFHLKKMLVGGFTRVFEIKSTFRNGEVGPHHEPEFHMLEWYRAFSDLDAIADDVEALLGTVTGLNAVRLQRTTMTELFKKAFAGFVLTPQTTRDELRSLAVNHGVRIEPSDTWDEIFFRLFLEHVEPGLGQDQPVLVRGYPPSQAALSRIGEDGFADRFEVYWRGMELANAFHELNDPVENEARFEIDRIQKAELGKKAVHRDDELVRALYFGLPPSGGIALGLERLFMAVHGIDKMASTRAFPFRRPDLNLRR